MDFDRLFRLAELARRPGRLPEAEAAFVRDEVPSALADFPHFERPEAIDHPGGFRVVGAPTGTFVRSALILAGQGALGRRAGGHRFYDRVERDLAMLIMRANFEGQAPRGAFCCAQCTLAILPVLDAGAIRYFECPPLAENVRTLIEEKQWRFSGRLNASQVSWALDGGRRRAPP